MLLLPGRSPFVSASTRRLLRRAITTYLRNAAEIWKNRLPTTSLLAFSSFPPPPPQSTLFHSQRQDYSSSRTVRQSVPQQGQAYEDWQTPAIREQGKGNVSKKIVPNVEVLPPSSQEAQNPTTGRVRPTRSLEAVQLGEEDAPLPCIVIDLDEGARLYTEVYASNSAGETIVLTKRYPNHQIEVQLNIPLEQAGECLEKLRQLMESNLDGSVYDVQGGETIHHIQPTSSGECRITFDMSPKQHNVAGDSTFAATALTITTTDEASGRHRSLEIDAQYVPVLVRALAALLSDDPGKFDGGEIRTRPCRTILLPNGKFWLEPGDKLLKITQVTFFKNASLHGCINVPYSSLQHFIDAITLHVEAKERKGVQGKHAAGTMELDPQTHFDFRFKPNVLRISEVPSGSEAAYENPDHHMKVWIRWTIMREFLHELVETLHDYETGWAQGQLTRLSRESSDYLAERIRREDHAREEERRQARLNPIPAVPHFFPPHKCYSSTAAYQSGQLKSMEEQVAGLKRLLEKRSLAVLAVELGSSAQLFLTVGEGSRGRYIKLWKYYTGYQRSAAQRISLSIELARSLLENLEKLVVGWKTDDPSSSKIAGSNRPAYSAQLKSEGRCLDIELLLPSGGKGGEVGEDTAELSLTTMFGSNNASQKVLTIDAGYVPEVRQALASLLREHGTDDYMSRSLKRRMFTLRDRQAEVLQLEPGDVALNLIKTTSDEYNSHIHVPYSSLPAFVKAVIAYSQQSDSAFVYGQEETQRITTNGQAQQIVFQPTSGYLEIVEVSTKGETTHRRSFYVPWRRMWQFAGILKEILHDYNVAKTNREKRVEKAK